MLPAELLCLVWRCQLESRLERVHQELTLTIPLSVPPPPQHWQKHCGVLHSKDATPSRRKWYRSSQSRSWCQLAWGLWPKTGQKLRRCERGNYYYSRLAASNMGVYLYR